MNVLLSAHKRYKGKQARRFLFQGNKKRGMRACEGGDAERKGLRKAADGTYAHEDPWRSERCSARTGKQLTRKSFSVAFVRKGLRIA
jgi:hypothetical protein